MLGLIVLFFLSLLLSWWLGWVISFLKWDIMVGVEWGIVIFFIAFFGGAWLFDVV